MEEEDFTHLARRFLRAEIGILGDPGHYPATAFLADSHYEYAHADKFDADVLLSQFRRAVRNECRRLLKALDGE